jgi:hypothetical protein
VRKTLDTEPHEMPDKVRCPVCEHLTRVRKDGTLAQHGKRESHILWVCGGSEKLAPLHSVTLRVIQRDPATNKATLWLADCACGTAWPGETYAAVEASWSAHAEEKMRPLREALAAKQEVASSNV